MIALDLLSKDFVKTDLDETVSKLIGKLKKKNKSHAVVFDGKKYIGIISKKAFLTSRIDPSSMKVSNILNRRSRSNTNLFVPELSPDTDLKEVARLMYTADVKLLSVFDKGRFLGVIEANDLLAAISTSYKGVPISLIYSRDPVTINIDDSVGKIIKIFNKEKVHRVAVIDKDNQFLGMLTLGDLIKKYYSSPVSALRMSNESKSSSFKNRGYDLGEKIGRVDASIETMISAAPLFSVKPDFSIAQAINIMVKAGISSVVVVEDKKVVGMLTVRDVLNDYAKA